MNKILIASMLAMAVVGCQNQSKKPSANTSVTDLTPTPVAPVYTAPAPVQPVSYEAPTATATPSYGMTSANATSTAGVTGGSYTVKKGDTLYGIAKKRYGDGKQWQKIATANPGLSASSLKVGQTIQVP